MDLLKFQKQWQSGISDDLRQKLQAAARQLGHPLSVTSGHRPPAYNKKVGGAKRSYHTRRGAVDIDMSGLQDAARGNLVNTLQSVGLTGFGTYDKSPNMLHVDTRPKPWFMHNKSNRNIKSAPDWFKNIALGQSSSAPATAAPSTGGVDVGKSMLARAAINAKPGLSVEKTNEGRIRMSMPGGDLAGLENLDAATAPGRLRSDSPIGLLDAIGGVPGPQGAPPAAPTMLASAPSAPAMPGGGGSMLGGIGNIMSALGGGAGNPQGDQQAQQQAEADAQRRMQWAYANGYGRGLI